MKRAPSSAFSLAPSLPPLTIGRYVYADLGHPITRSSTIRDLGDVQIDLSRKYRGLPSDRSVRL